MPSAQAIITRRVKALQRIDATLGTNIAAMSERDENIKIMKQTEAIAEAVEIIMNYELEEQTEQLAEIRTLVKSGRWTKAELELLVIENDDDATDE